MYVGPWHEYRLYQIMMLKEKYKDSNTPLRDHSNESKASDHHSAASASIAETSHSRSGITSNPTKVLKGVYSHWKDYDTQSSFAKHILDSK